ncbi:sigma 54-interacting transcriptional regulator [Anaerotalea alkaliphila]|uniref:PAS domain S-box protein n=1 Tax=Anaerotalea alkaliphila TaxID=2662126 RepID=A0A7X5HWB4_9FIRM|nr:PrpR N-terminal domain-containing protein [Anaerotalea alkaliphila]NDL67813.1 PAS domain S-box protein [Anaerotalea alkaliphila]
MSGIAVFVPDREMHLHVENHIKASEESRIELLKLVPTEDVLGEAQTAIDQGTNIFIARGRHAEIIRKNTNAQVIDIVMTAQELGLLVQKAKGLIDRPRITIGLFGWGNMFCDTSHFDQLFGVTLQRYTLDIDGEWRNMILDAAGDQLDVIIGSKSVIDCANQIDIPGIRLSGTGESLDIALKAGEALYRRMEMEKHNHAQFSTVLDSSSNGILKLSPNGKILIMNRIMEDILGQKSDALVGMPVDRFFTEIRADKVAAVLEGTIDNYSLLLTYKGQELVLIVEPIVVDGNISGAIMTFNRLHRRKATDRSVRDKHFTNGHVAQATFDVISKNMKGLQKVIELAQLYAFSSSPMLVEALSGPELETITQGIHNYGMRKNGPFLAVNMAGMTEDQQFKSLFGNPQTKDPGALLSADDGTLVIQSIDKLSLPLQYNLIKAIRSKRISPDNTPSSAKMFDTRIIACTSKNLGELRKNFLFRSDLYFTLNSLRLRIPNLKDRPEDVEHLLDTYFRQYMKQYSRYHVLSAGARKVLLEYPWEGNSIQLQSFCERMVLTAQRRTLTDDYVLSLLEELYESSFTLYGSPAGSPEGGGAGAAASDPLQELIHRTLKKNGGNRKLTAQELGMSTTTLWRKMKKYGM